MGFIQDFFDLEVQRGKEVVSSGLCNSGITIGMSLRASGCSDSRRHGRGMVGNGILKATAWNVRIISVCQSSSLYLPRDFYRGSRTVSVMLSSKGESSAEGAGKNSGKKYEVVEETEVVDSNAYEMESGSLVQNALAAILLGALGLSAINILAKIGVITIALISVAVRYSIIGILIVVLVCLFG